MDVYYFLFHCCSHFGFYNTNMTVVDMKNQQVSGICGLSAREGRVEVEVPINRDNQQLYLYAKTTS